MGWDGVVRRESFERNWGLTVRQNLCNTLGNNVQIRFERTVPNLVSKLRKEQLMLLSRLMPTDLHQGLSGARIDR